MAGRVRDVPGDVVLPAHHLVPQRLGERPRDGGGHGRHEAHPVAGQAGREHGHRQDEATRQTRHGGVTEHHVAVREHLRPADVEGPADVRGHAGAADQGAQHVPDGDGLDPGVHPARSDHDGQAFGEVAQHLEGGRAGADDHGRAQHRGRYAGVQEDAAHLGTRAQVRRQFPLGDTGRGEPSEIDDASYSGGTGPLPEDSRRPPVGLLEVASRAQRVHQVVGDIDAPHGLLDRSAVRDVPADHLRLPCPRMVAQPLRGAGQAAHPVAAWPAVPGRAYRRCTRWRR